MGQGFGPHILIDQDKIHTYLIKQVGVTLDFLRKNFRTKKFFEFTSIRSLFLIDLNYSFNLYKCTDIT